MDESRWGAVEQHRSEEKEANDNFCYICPFA